MVKFLTQLVNEDIDETFSRIHEPFIFESEVLAKAGLKSRVEVKAGFIHDYESVPVIKGSCKQGGVGHDYLSRSNSIPEVTKKIAADVYFEIMETIDLELAQDDKSKDGFLSKPVYVLNIFGRWIRRHSKYLVVRVAQDYWHRHKVEATYEEMSGKREE